MGNFQGKLSHVGQVALLGCPIWVRYPVKSVGQRLVVGEDEKAPPFGQESEMLNCRHASQQLSIKSAVAGLSAFQLPAEETRRGTGAII